MAAVRGDARTARTVRSGRGLSAFAWALRRRRHPVPRHVLITALAVEVVPRADRYHARRGEPPSSVQVQAIEAVRSGAHDRPRRILERATALRPELKHAGLARDRANARAPEVQHERSVAPEQESFGPGGVARHPARKRGYRCDCDKRVPARGPDSRGTCDATVYVVVNVAGGVADARAAKTAATTDDAESATTTAAKRARRRCLMASLLCRSRPSHNATHKVNRSAVSPPQGRTDAPRPRPRNAVPSRRPAHGWCLWSRVRKSCRGDMRSSAVDRTDSRAAERRGGSSRRRTKRPSSRARRVSGHRGSSLHPLRTVAPGAGGGRGPALVGSGGHLCGDVHQRDRYDDRQRRAAGHVERARRGHRRVAVGARRVPCLARRSVAGRQRARRSVRAPAGVCARADRLRGHVRVGGGRRDGGRADRGARADGRGRGVCDASGAVVAGRALPARAAGQGGG